MSGPSTRDPEFLTASERQASLQASNSRRIPRIAIIGAGQRGHAYASALKRDQAEVVIAAVAEPAAARRAAFGKRYIWTAATGDHKYGTSPREDQAFDSWEDFAQYEKIRQEVQIAGERTYPGVDGVFVCTQDSTHKDIIAALEPLGLHIMCEKPMAGTLRECAAMYSSLTVGGTHLPRSLFAMGHVLRYSPHNMLLRRLVVDDKAIGSVLSVEHTEPVGWWHFAHSYVRGNWRREEVAGPVLLCKSCHDIDFVLWLLAYRSERGPEGRANMPSRVGSMGNLSYFTRSRKPAAAGKATNCLQCPIESTCNYSARKIYLEKIFDQGVYGWPTDVLVPEIEDLVRKKGVKTGRRLVQDMLARDYDRQSCKEADIAQQQWYGRCVWESDNDVLDEQIVTMQWDGNRQDQSHGGGDDGSASAVTASSSDVVGDDEENGPKLAVLHMTANTKKQCERRGWISGTRGEIEYDSFTITVNDFATGSSKTYEPKRAAGGHGGGDGGLAGQFVSAMDAVLNGDVDVPTAQIKYMGCTLEEVFMSHAMVFAAEEARKGNKVVDWADWWERAKNLKGV